MLDQADLVPLTLCSRALVCATVVFVDMPHAGMIARGRCDPMRADALVSPKSHVTGRPLYCRAATVPRKAPGRSVGGVI